MSADDVLTAIQRHRAFSQAKIDALKREIATIERDTDDLAIAEKVVRRLASETTAPAPEALESDEGDQKNSGEDAAAAVQSLHEVIEQRPHEGEAEGSSDR